MAINAIRLWGAFKHQHNVKKSRRLLDKLSTFEYDAQALAYLRKIGPLLFEELTLSLLELRGIFVLRSKRYSGDGGIDGQLRLNGGLALIQAKRYTGYISPAHVTAFALLCQKRRQRGVFIHTGRTGRASWTVAAEHPHIEILSGEQMLALITGHPLVLFGQTLRKRA